ncbi:MAG: TIGR00730 family Rossman fold protein [Caldilineaceae bacterium]
MNQLESICVFCGSSAGAQPIFQEQAQQLGAALVARGIHLVYGGGSIGLMGAVARTVATGGGKVTGVIPRSLKTKEVVGEVYGELVVVKSMHERKATMARLAQAFIAMPGGFGTLDELFEVITWGQLGIHAKPIGLLNVAGFFDFIESWVEHALSQGFIRPQHRHLLVIEREPAALIERLLHHTPPAGLVQWLDLDET